MATYTSQSINDRALISTSHQHGEALRTVAETITLPAGTGIGAGDILKFLRLEAGHTIVSARALVSANLAATLSFNFGHYQVTQDGQPVRNSPANAATAFQTGNTTLNGAGVKVFTVASVDPLAGPADIALTVNGTPGTPVTAGERSITLILEVVRTGRPQAGARLDRGGY